MNGYWMLGLDVYTVVIVIANVMVFYISKNLSIVLIGTVLFFMSFYVLVILTMSEWNEFPFTTDNVYFGIY